MNPLREILALFTVDTTGVEQGVKKSDGLINSLKGELLKLGTVVAGAFAVGSLVSFGQELMREAEALSALSGTLGMSTAELQGWQWAAESSGVEAAKLTAAARKLQEAAGNPVKAGVFTKYKIELRDASGVALSTSQLLERTTDVLSDIEDPAERAAAAMEMFGGEAASLLPLLGKGGDEIIGLRREVEELGVTFSDDFVKSSTRANANIDRMKAAFRGVATQGLDLLLPSLVELTNIALGITKAFVSAFRAFADFVKQTKLVEAAVALLSAKGVMILVSAIGKAIIGVGGLRAAFLRLLPLLWKVVLPMLAIEDFLVFLSGGQSVFGEALDGIFGGGSAAKFRDTIMEIFQFLKNGEIGAALERTFSGLGDMFSALGRLFMSILAKAWNTIVEKSGRMASMLGLSKIEDSDVEMGAPAISSREAGARLLEASTGGIVGHAGVPLKDISSAIEASNNWVEMQQTPGLMVPGAPDQNVENHVSIENRITVQVPPGEGDLGGRVGRAAAQGAAQSFDVRAIQAALVPQPAK